MSDLHCYPSHHDRVITTIGDVSVDLDNNAIAANSDLLTALISYLHTAEDMILRVYYDRTGNTVDCIICHPNPHWNPTNASTDLIGTLLLGDFCTDDALRLGYEDFKQEMKNQMWHTRDVQVPEDAVVQVFVSQYLFRAPGEVVPDYPEEYEMERRGRIVYDSLRAPITAGAFEEGLIQLIDIADLEFQLPDEAGVHPAQLKLKLKGASHE